LNSLSKILDQNLVNLKISSNFIIKDISSLNVVRNNSLVFISENKFYEKLISNPNLIVPTVLDFCGLNNSEESIKFINTSKNSYLDTQNSGGHWIDINR